MRKTLVFAVISALALLAPAAAQAHHLDQDTSTITCVLSENQPTVRISANYLDFSPWDQPVAWSASIDKVTVGGGTLTWVGPDFRHNVSFRTTAGSHDVVYQSSWNGGENGAYLSRRGLVCPAPVPPPVKPPPPTVVVVTPPPPPPPVVVSCPCPPKHPVRPKCVCPHIHVIKPDTTKPSQMHGTFRFGGRVTNNRHAHIVAVRITVRAVGRGRHVRAGTLRAPPRCTSGEDRPDRPLQPRRVPALPRVGRLQAHDALPGRVPRQDDRQGGRPPLVQADRPLLQPRPDPPAVVGIRSST
jgi:hypothetical protein